MAQSMKLVPGGKGANQAYALGKLGANTSMIGAVGTDTFGEQMMANLENVGVATDGIKKIAGTETGKAFIEIEKSGQNSISVIPGLQGKSRRYYCRWRLLPGRIYESL